MSFVLLMSLAFAGVSCSNSDDSSEGGNGGNYAGWWYYNAGYSDGDRMLVLLSEDGSVLRAGTPDLTSYEDGVELSGDELEDAKTKYSYKNESARAYLKKFADSGLSRLSYWCTVDSNQPFTWGIECLKNYIENECGNCGVEKKPDGSYNLSVTLSESFNCFFMVDDTLRGYRGSYPTVKLEVDYISTAVDQYYRDTLFYFQKHSRPTAISYSSDWANGYVSCDMNQFYDGKVRTLEYDFGINSEKLGTGTAILKLTYSHPKAERDLIVWIEFKNATSSQQ